MLPLQRFAKIRTDEPVSQEGCTSTGVLIRRIAWASWFDLEPGPSGNPDQRSERSNHHRARFKTRVASTRVLPSDEPDFVGPEWRYQPGHNEAGRHRHSRDCPTHARLLSGAVPLLRSG